MQLNVGKPDKHRSTVYLFIILCYFKSFGEFKGNIIITSLKPSIRMELLKFDEIGIK